MKQAQENQAKQTPSSRRFQCPTCRRPFMVPCSTKPGQVKFFPFCSERCKLIDLGAWLDAEYRIPSRPEEASEDALGDGFGDPETTP